MQNPNQLLSEDEQIAKFAKLYELLENPWFKHFQTLWLNQKDNTIEMIFNAPIPNKAAEILREQSIGEARAYAGAAEQPQTTYDELLVKLESNKP
jgi:hypothetical protein